MGPIDGLRRGSRPASGRVDLPDQCWPAAGRQREDDAADSMGTCLAAASAPTVWAQVSKRAAGGFDAAGRQERGLPGLGQSNQLSPLLTMAWLSDFNFHHMKI